MICNIPVEDDKTTTSSKFPKKNLFSYIKSQKSESSNIHVATLRQNGQLHSDTKTKPNILNEQFQKAFTPATDDPIPNKGQSQHPQMRDIIITENGINKLLQNINIHKASGPDNIHGRILKECTTQIAPILTTLFSVSLKTIRFQKIGDMLMSVLHLKKVIKTTL